MDICLTVGLFDFIVKLGIKLPETRLGVLPAHSQHQMTKIGLPHWVSVPRELKIGPYGPELIWHFAI